MEVMVVRKRDAARAGIARVARLYCFALLWCILPAVLRRNMKKS
ncbi:hypothetical protein J2789_005712 [Variovorax paradoxus]|nr:hypothetical protein [Variovorax paradoxus]MDR6523022.1 hypothetical protein [Variovorax paradoxus]